ncbi:F-box protein At5g07610-like [Durio zibethinus]|uniref:F-box protein At5g07610-like n=1 Tax=Durio zibethinus TaxID=66656 RepID=A0A6P5Z224_DURZI|nr:F-box protein At5g07610-like [Durio zibethinus]
MKNTSIIITSAETIGNNPDLLTQILLRLPTKPLLKFKCVSKQWLSLISCPNFCLSHTRHHQTNGFLTPTALLVKGYYTLPSEFDMVPLKHNSRVPFFDYMNNAPNINVIQSCYGLFLCESVADSSKDIISRYFICNPTTKKFKELSFPKNPFQGSKFYVSMAFDPLKSPHYKIICVREVSDKPSKFELDIYSSQTDSWSLSRISFGVTDFICFEDAVFCNGKIHWNCHLKDSLYFDVAKERLEVLPMPIPTMEAPKERSHLGECGGVLYIAVTYCILVCLEFDVFEMASDYSHWFLKHRLYIGDLVKDFPEIIWSYDFYSPGFSDVCITQFGKEEEPRVVVWIENKVIFYDFKDGAWKSLYDLRPSVNFDSLDECYHYSDLILPYQSIHAFQYFENLSSI